MIRAPDRARWPCSRSRSAAAARPPRTPTSAPAERYGLRLQYREFRPTLTGDIAEGVRGPGGLVVDFNDDLGFQDERTFDVRGHHPVQAGQEAPRLLHPARLQRRPRSRRKTFTYGETRYERFDRVVTAR